MLASGRLTQCLPNRGGRMRASARKLSWAVWKVFIVDEVQLADEADDNFIKALQGVRRKTTTAYLKGDATFKGWVST